MGNEQSEISESQLNKKKFLDQLNKCFLLLEDFIYNLDRNSISGTGYLQMRKDPIIKELSEFRYLLKKNKFENITQEYLKSFRRTLAHIQNRFMIQDEEEVNLQDFKQLAKFDLTQLQEIGDYFMASLKNKDNKENLPSYFEGFNIHEHGSVIPIENTTNTRIINSNKTSNTQKNNKKTNINDNTSILGEHEMMYHKLLDVSVNGIRQLVYDLKISKKQQTTMNLNEMHRYLTKLDGIIDKVVKSNNVELENLEEAKKLINNLQKSIKEYPNDNDQGKFKLLIDSKKYIEYFGAD